MDSLNLIWQILSNPFGLLLAIFFFCASIFVHEYGHYLAARWRGLKIERFSIGMGPRLFGWKDKRGVDWRVSALPIGGYVLLPQLADMAAIEGNSRYAKEDLPELGWADKVIVAAAGAVFNVLFALVLGTVLWLTGIPRDAYLDSTTVGWVYEEVRQGEDGTAPGPAFTAGLRPGDQILRIDGKPIRTFEDILVRIVAGSERDASGNPLAHVTYLREGEETTVEVHPVLAGKEQIRAIGLISSSPVIVGMALEHSPAADAGLQAGDEIVALDGETIFSRDAIFDQISTQGTTPFAVTYRRDGTEHTVTLAPEEAIVRSNGDTQAMIGIQFLPTLSSENNINPFEQVKRVVVLTFQTLHALLSPRSNVGLDDLNGVVGILYFLKLTAEEGILVLLSLVVLINVNLAILNLLPLPILDGGHIVLATWKKLFGKPVPARIVMGLQSAMIVFLLGVMLYVTFHDILKIGENESALREARESQAQRVGPYFPGSAEYGDWMAKSSGAPDPS